MSCLNENKQLSDPLKKRKTENFYEQFCFLKNTQSSIRKQQQHKQKITHREGEEEEEEEEEGETEGEVKESEEGTIFFHPDEGMSE